MFAPKPPGSMHPGRRPWLSPRKRYPIIDRTGKDIQPFLPMACISCAFRTICQPVHPEAPVLMLR